MALLQLILLCHCPASWCIARCMLSLQCVSCTATDLYCWHCCPSPACLPAGKTRCINHFIINGAWYLVDLPGYGWVPEWGGVEMGWELTLGQAGEWGCLSVHDCT